MFVEPSPGGVAPGQVGWIEVVCGSMFSGKTEELIRRLRRATIAQQRVEIFKPKVDQRYSIDKVVSHDDNAIKSYPVDKAEDILLRVGQSEVIGIDEAQFFDNHLVDVVENLANAGKRVIVAGLDMDFRGKAFEPMDKIMAIAEYITKVHAICMECGSMASYSHRRNSSSEQVVIGEKDIYVALCRSCFNEKNIS